LIDPELSDDQKRDGVMATVRSAFKPEFLNRLDDIVIFSALDRLELGQIVELNIERLGKRLAARRLQLAVTPAARTWLAEHGYDPIYGARPLRRLMQQQIDDRLANLLLAGEIHDGSSVRVDVAEGGVDLIVTPGETLNETLDEGFGELSS
jgi:ATP-dependent Clp protease ATP-binding subunit ClpB